MDRLKVKFLDSEFKTPLVMASGTFGYGVEYKDYANIDTIGGISSKGLTFKAQKGNGGTRLHEVSSGVMNSIGLENPGVEAFIENHLPDMKSTKRKVLVNFGAHSINDFISGIKLLNKEDIDFIELNISCPNVKEGGMAFGMCENSAFEVTKAVKEISKHPLIVKLSPNAPSITDIAKAVEKAGADSIALVNTFLGFAIDIEKKKPIFDNLYAGVSGPSIKPIALRMVHQVAKEVKIPILAYGGVSNYKDVIEYIMAGASLVGIGSAIFGNPWITNEIAKDLIEYMKRHNISSLEEIKGII